MEYILNRVNDEMKNNFELCLNSILLAKSFAAKLWFDTPHIFRQFERIGPTTSQVFVDANYTTFESIQMLTLFEIQRVIYFIQIKILIYNILLRLRIKTPNLVLKF